MKWFSRRDPNQPGTDFLAISDRIWELQAAAERRARRKEAADAQAAELRALIKAKPKARKVTT